MICCAQFPHFKSSATKLVASVCSVMCHISLQILQTLFVCMIRLTLKALGLFLPVQHWGGGGVFHPFWKIRSRHPRKLKLAGLIAYIMFYKICKFESSTITNNVIMTSFPTTMAKFGPPRNQTNYISFERY